MGSFRECHWMKVLELLCDIAAKSNDFLDFSAAIYRQRLSL